MIQILQGRQLAWNMPVDAPTAEFALPGLDAQGELTHWPVDIAQLAGGMLLLGDRGTGKSNVMHLLARQLRRALPPEDLLVAFDRRGDLSAYARPGDWVPARDGWNLAADADPARLRSLIEILTQDPDDRAQLAALANNPAALHCAAKEYAGLPLKDDGDSLRDFAAQGGRALFLRETPAAAWMLETLLDQVGDRRVYLLLDDFECLPRVRNLTAPRNVCLTAALQGFADLDDTWDAVSLRRLPGWFATIAAFRAGDPAVRSLISRRCGENRAQLPDGQVILTNAVEPWDVLDLPRGQAIVSSPSCPPFAFRFKNYPKRS